MPVSFSPLLTIGAIVLLDLVLSGDNALVIAAAASKLPRTQRTLAIAWGGLGAMIVRISLTAGASELLQITLVRAIGGALLFLVAVRVIWPWEGRVRLGMAHGFLMALATIIAADITMSLDNILAIAALAQGQVVYLAIGLCLSMVVLFVASAIIARVMEALPWLLDLAAVVIAWTAADLFFADPLVHARLPLDDHDLLIAEVACAGGVLVVDGLLRLIAWRLRQRVTETPSSAVLADGTEAYEEQPTGRE